MTFHSEAQMLHLRHDVPLVDPEAAKRLAVRQRRMRRILKWVRGIRNPKPVINVRGS